MKATARAVLRGNLLLRNLADESLDRIAALAARRSYPKDTVIFAQGDVGDALYAVISGQVRIWTSTPNGREVFLNIMESGDTFGEIAVIDGRPRTASAMAVTDVELFLIRRPDLLGLMARDPALPMHLLKLFCQRLRWTSDLIEESALHDLQTRLARRVLRLTADHGQVDGNRTTLLISQGDLANFLSVSRQVVNQYLQEWRERGWISLSRGKLVIENPEALARASGDAGS